MCIIMTSLKFLLTCIIVGVYLQKILSIIWELSSFANNLYFLVENLVYDNYECIYYFLLQFVICIYM